MRFFFDGLVAIGIFLGISIAIFAEFFLDIFGATFEPSEVFAGTLLGASIALVGTLFTIYAAEEARKNTQSAKNLELLYLLFESLSEMCANLKFVKEHIETSLEEAKQQKLQFSAFAVRPISGTIERAKMPYAAKTMLLAEGHSKLYNLIGSIDAKANGQFDAFERAQSDRSRLLSICDLNFDGKNWGIIFAPENKDEVLGRSTVLGEHFQEQLHGLATLLATGIEAMELTGQIIRDNGNPKFKFEIKTV